MEKLYFMKHISKDFIKKVISEKQLIEDDEFNLLGVWVKFFRNSRGKYVPISSQRFCYELQKDERQFLLMEMVEQRQYTVKEIEILQANFICKE